MGIYEIIGLRRLNAIIRGLRQIQSQIIGASRRIVANEVHFKQRLVIAWPVVRRAVYKSIRIQLIAATVVKIELAQTAQCLIVIGVRQVKAACVFGWRLAATKPPDSLAVVSHSAHVLAQMLVLALGHIHLDLLARRIVKQLRFHRAVLFVYFAAVVVGLTAFERVLRILFPASVQCDVRRRTERSHFGEHDFGLADAAAFIGSSALWRRGVAQFFAKKRVDQVETVLYGGGEGKRRVLFLRRKHTIGDE